MFQVMTGDAWSDIARQLFVVIDNPPAVTIFFVSFQLIVSMVLVQVVICVLLEEFSKAAETPISHSSFAGSSGVPSKYRPFLPIVNRLIHCNDQQDLDRLMSALWFHVVANGLEQETPKEDFVCENVKLRKQEVQGGLLSLACLPPLFLTDQGWEEIVVKEDLCEEDDLLSYEGFQQILYGSMKEYQMQQLSMALRSPAEFWTRDQIIACMLSLKGVMLDLSLVSRRMVTRDKSSRRCSMNGGEDLLLNKGDPFDLSHAHDTSSLKFVHLSNVPSASRFRLETERALSGKEVRD